VEEKRFMFLMASECDTQFAAEVPAFVAEIQRIFTTTEIALSRPSGAHEVLRAA
jgi:hypothetical protein